MVNIINNKKLKKIVIRVDGHKKTGMGHISRMITLAKYLNELGGFEIVFVTKKSKPALDIICRQRFKVHVIELNLSVEQELNELSSVFILEEPDVIIIDVLGVSENSFYLNCIKERSGALTISFNDTHEKMPELPADIVINSSIIQMRDRTANSQQTYLGLDYCLLAPEYANDQLSKTRHESVKRVMICMGGVDYNSMTIKVLKALDASVNVFEFDVILNRAFTDQRKISQITKSMRHVANVHYDVDGIHGLLRSVDFAVTAGGNAHSERVCVGVPGLVISQDAHQYESALEYENYGATISQGLHSDLNEVELLRSFNVLFESPRLQRDMIACGLKLIDGLGLHRISKLIMREN